MHEMSIAGAVLDSVLRHARGRRVTRVGLRVGSMRQVVPSALDFAWQLIREETVAAGAPLELETVAAAVRCRRCTHTTPQPRFPLRCGACGSMGVDVVRGGELEIQWIEVEGGSGVDASGPALVEEAR